MSDQYSEVQKANMMIYENERDIMISRENLNIGAFDLSIIFSSIVMFALLIFSNIESSIYNDVSIICFSLSALITILSFLTANINLNRAMENMNNFVIETNFESEDFEYDKSEKTWVYTIHRNLQWMCFVLFTLGMGSLVIKLFV